MQFGSWLYLVKTKTSFNFLTISADHVNSFPPHKTLVLYAGVMKLEATKFRPREVVKHVLQTAAASLQKMLTLEGNVADDIPIEVRTLQHFHALLTNILHCH